MAKTKPTFVRIAVLSTLIFGTFHLFIFFCWYFRNIAIEIPFIIGSLIFLALSIRLENIFPLSLRFYRKKRQPTAVGVIEIVVWYVVMILLYALLWAKFDFPLSLEDEIWRVLIIGYSLFFAGAFVASILFEVTKRSVKIIYRDICNAARVIPRICSILSIYLLIDIIFALVYRIVSLVHPTSFDRPIDVFVDAFYFSTVTITTLGYGEIHPSHTLTKMLVSLEALLGITLLAAVLATAIAVAIKQERQTDNDSDANDEA